MSLSGSRANSSISVHSVASSSSPGLGLLPQVAARRTSLSVGSPFSASVDNVMNINTNNERNNTRTTVNTSSSSATANNTNILSQYAKEHRNNSRRVGTPISPTSAEKTRSLSSLLANNNNNNNNNNSNNNSGSAPPHHHHHNLHNISTNSLDIPQISSGVASKKSVESSLPASTNNSFFINQSRKSSLKGANNNNSNNGDEQQSPTSKRRNSATFSLTTSNNSNNNENNSSRKNSQDLTTSNITNDNNNKSRFTSNINYSAINNNNSSTYRSWTDIKNASKDSVYAAAANSAWVAKTTKELQEAISYVSTENAMMEEVLSEPHQIVSNNDLANIMKSVLSAASDSKASSIMQNRKPPVLRCLARARQEGNHLLTHSSSSSNQNTTANATTANGSSDKNSSSSSNKQYNHQLLPPDRSGTEYLPFASSAVPYSALQQEQRDMIQRNKERQGAYDRMILDVERQQMSFHEQFAKLG